MSHKSDPSLAEDDLPPPYTQTTFESAPATAGIYDADSHASIFASHLSALQDNIRAAQARQASVCSENDSYALALIVPHMEALLSSIASLHPPPAEVEATMVPESAISKEWSFVGTDQAPASHIQRVFRVRQDAKQASDVKGAEKEKQKPRTSNDSLRDLDRGFDGWGRWTDDSARSDSTGVDNMWWSDEATARRLAKYLEPDRPTASVDRQTVRAQVSQAKEVRKSQRWSLFKRDGRGSSASTEQSVAPISAASRSEQGVVTMTVRAEEVTFRRENAFGIWESKTGWGLVARITIPEDKKFRV